MATKLPRGYKGTRKPRGHELIIDLGTDLDEVLGNPCEALRSVYGRTRQAVSDGLGAVGSVLSGVGDAVSALGDQVGEQSNLQTDSSER